MGGPGSSITRMPTSLKSDKPVIIIPSTNLMVCILSWQLSTGYKKEVVQWRDPKICMKCRKSLIGKRLKRDMLQPKKEKLKNQWQLNGWVQNSLIKMKKELVQKLWLITRQSWFFTLDQQMTWLKLLTRMNLQIMNACPSKISWKTFTNRSMKVARKNYRSSKFQEMTMWRASKKQSKILHGSPYHLRSMMLESVLEIWFHTLRSISSQHQVVLVLSMVRLALLSTRTSLIRKSLLRLWRRWFQNAEQNILGNFYVPKQSIEEGNYIANGKSNQIV